LGNVYTIEIQPDGKILIGGNFSSYRGDSVGAVVRLNEDGTRDTSFAYATNFQSVNDFAIQPDGKIIVGALSVYRLNADGTMDGTFN
jgi:uncharacterized delta-60 repeat protein